MANKTVTHFHWAWSLLMVAVLALAWVPPLVERMLQNRLEAQHAVGTYLSVEYVDVGNSVEGDPVIMKIGRAIHREFNGSYTVEVRRFPTREIVCTASDKLRYRPGALLPDPVTLSWWADNGTCRGSALPAGDYVITTTWTVYPPVYGIPNPTLTVESNAFNVSAIPPSVARNAIQGQQTIKRELEQLRNELQELKKP